ncbi:MAG: VWA domain-containing protein [Methyloligella sp. ZOD6]
MRWLLDRPAFRDLRFWLIAAALLVLIVGLLLPKFKMTREVYDIMAFVDITISMNTRDVEIGGETVSRLEAVKTILPKFVAGLPCQSRFGLGIFTERRDFVLFRPMEVCENFASIDASIESIDWRMGWDADSYVTKGVHRAIELAGRLDSSLMFLTDGHEAPPLPYTGMDPFEGKPGEVKGILVGVGGYELSPIPKFDDQGNEIGVYGPEDVLQESRFGMAPPSAKERPGYHPRNNPFGDMVEGNEHLGQVKEEHLKALAAQTGLDYAHLENASRLVSEVERAAQPREVVVDTDVRPYPAALALLLLVLLYGLVPLKERFSRKAPASSSGQFPITIPKIKTKEGFACL